MHARIITLTILLFAVAADSADKIDSQKELLALLQEPELSKIVDANAEIYRITWNPTFYHPTSIRVYKQKDKYLLTVTQLSGQGGYDIGSLKLKKSRMVSRNEWNKLRDLFTEMNFWITQSYEEADYLCLDSTLWVYEASVEGRYHVVERYCPTDKSFLKAGHFLLSLSGLSAKPEEFN